MTQVQWVKAGTLLPKKLADVQAAPTIPVLTLDALEAWLNEAWAMGYKAPMGHLGVIQYLLAQVRAWKVADEK